MDFTMEGNSIQNIGKVPSQDSDSSLRSIKFFSKIKSILHESNSKPKKKMSFLLKTQIENGNAKIDHTKSAKKQNENHCGIKRNVVRSRAKKISDRATLTNKLLAIKNILNKNMGGKSHSKGNISTKISQENLQKRFDGNNLKRENTMYLKPKRMNDDYFLMQERLKSSSRKELQTPSAKKQSSGIEVHHKSKTNLIGKQGHPKPGLASSQSQIMSIK